MLIFRCPRAHTLAKMRSASTAENLLSMRPQSLQSLEKDGPSMARRPVPQKALKT
eukprot:CAMPEP_0181520202 /NCGR_PEP_ID=MMETSP1110-20121109/66184_1 /TAXON_ID=174948 /ORGANISM="Symbiodinium sp., Strain CCMP421" /LENGTH=54 /DNA_ID=CAMNT_0023650675 /DNA_START=165 /DNA_END=326 /DNA_ORIENTATION=+